MDFKKIVLTFVGIFLVLDIFLGFSWIRMRQAVSTSSTTNEILNEMKSEGIEFGTTSNEKPYGAYISGDETGQYLDSHRGQLDKKWQVGFAVDELTAVLSPPLNIGDTNKEKVAALKKIVANPADVIRGTQYVYDEDQSEIKSDDTGDVQEYVFVQKVSDNRRFYSSHAQIRFSVDNHDNLLSYTQTYVNNPTVLRDESQLISQAQALTVVYQYNEIANNGRVLWSKLNYAQLLTIDDDTIYVPAWFFAVRDSSGEVSLQKVNAFNGTLLKQAQ
jgi:regulatory protein YycI of two-component signal transduction system YycFG